MSQHDQNIANAGGASVRSDINNALAALFGVSSGASAPATTIAYQLWVDTTNGLVQQRNAANSAWLTLFQTGKNYPAFPSGTRMLFQQTAAPTGWTKESSATYNDAALRFTTGTVGTGGADAFNTHFGTSKSTAGHTLTEAQIPSHTHNVARNQAGGAAGVSTSNNSDPGNFIATTATGGGGSHSHTLSNFDLKWADCIIAAKD